MAEAPALAPVHKRRARRANLVVNDKESLPKASAGKSSGPAPKAVSKVAPAAPPAGKAAPKKKSTWHDPFAD